MTTPEQTLAAERASVMLAFSRGEKIEWRNRRWAEGDWCGYLIEPSWDWREIDYRVTPKPSPAPDQVPWDDIASRFGWFARDENGWWLYEDKPTKNATGWVPFGRCIRAKNFAHFIPGTTPWQDSLQRRPGVEE